MSQKFECEHKRLGRAMRVYQCYSTLRHNYCTNIICDLCLVDLARLGYIERTVPGVEVWVCRECAEPEFL